MVRAPPCHGGGRGFESHPGRCMIYAVWRLRPAICRCCEIHIFSYIIRGNAGVAELADAQDLKSCGTNLPYRFDSGRRHCRKSGLIQYLCWGEPLFSFWAQEWESEAERENLTSALTAIGRSVQKNKFISKVLRKITDIYSVRY